MLFDMPFYMREFSTWYLKFSFVGLVERMARGWSRVKTKVIHGHKSLSEGLRLKICTMTIRHIISCFFFAKTELNLLYQDVSYGFDVFVSIIWRNIGLVTARVWIARSPCCAKSDPWVARVTLILVVANNTNSGFRISTPTTNEIEPFFVAVVL